MGAAETIALGGLGVLFLALLWWTRRARVRTRISPLSRQLEAAFEQRALEALRSLAGGASDRLANLERQLQDGKAAEAQAHDAARLARKLAALRADPATTGKERPEWDYLSAATAERWPLLEPAIVELDLPALTRAGASSAELREELGPLVTRWRGALERATAELDAEPALLWSVIDLLAVTLLVVAPEPAVENAAAHQVRPRPPRPEPVAAVRAGTAIALRLLETAPRTERVPHDGLPVPALADLTVAAAVVRRRLNRAATTDELERARALVLGEPSALWVALSVLPRHEYPAAAAVAHARLAEVARRAAAGEPPPDGGEALARDLLGNGSATAFAATLRALAAGLTAEELFGDPSHLAAPAAGEG